MNSRDCSLYSDSPLGHSLRMSRIDTPRATGSGLLIMTISLAAICLIARVFI